MTPVVPVRRAALSLLASLLALAAMGGLVGCSRSGSPSFHGIDLTGATYAQTLDLPDAQGRPRSLADFRGKVVLVFFGFTQCPDVCPTALAQIADIRRSLGADGARVQPVFVTVDPERDTPEILAAYTKAFGDDVIALRGTLEQTTAVAKDFKVYFKKVPGQTEGSYTLDHTAGLYAFDAQGRVRLFLRHGMPTEQLAADVKALVGGA
jgi:protein SCO1